MLTTDGGWGQLDLNKRIKVKNQFIIAEDELVKFKKAST